MKLTIEFADLEQEAREAGRRPAAIKRRLWSTLRAVSLKAERFIKIRMPVDTGAARASWGHSSSPAPADAGIWIENEEDMSIEQGSTLGYIQYLNEGSSQQAPAGFLDAEVTRAINELYAGAQDAFIKEWEE